MEENCMMVAEITRRLYRLLKSENNRNEDSSENNLLIKRQQDAIAKLKNGESSEHDKTYPILVYPNSVEEDTPYTRSVIDLPEEEKIPPYISWIHSRRYGTLSYLCKHFYFNIVLFSM